MSFREKSVRDRLGAAEEARKEMLQRFKARPATDDPAVVERRMAREAISAAREARLTERETAKRLKAAQETAEREAREAAEREQRLIREAQDAVDHMEREVALALEKKAARDARYAARKARK